MKVGDKVWRFDINNRIYPKGSGISSGPVWREHWVETEITGETPRSWIVGKGRNPIKYPKSGKDYRGPRLAFSEEDINRAAFIEKSWAIADKVRQVRDYDTLVAIAKLVGYEVSQ